jgi:hypothetical protein
MDVPITALQRAKKLVNLVGHLGPKLQNPGHTKWDPANFPEPLLLEIESEVLIRDIQEQIAPRMRNARPGHNLVMQLNMGEGKTSVIVPLVAAALGDGSCLIRVIVAKPQPLQMFRMLFQSWGGQQVYHLPPWRRTDLWI